MTLGQSIKSIRKRLGETLVQFSERLGTDNSVISRYENDRVVPSRSMLLLIAQFAESPGEKTAISKALGSALDEAGKKLLADADELLASMQVDDLTRDRFRSAVSRIVHSGDIDRSLVKFLELFERNSNEPARKYIEDWVWSLDQRLADFSVQIKVPEMKVSVDPEEARFLKNAREFFRSADTNVVQEVESLMATRPVKQKRKLADVG